MDKKRFFDLYNKTSDFSKNYTSKSYLLMKRIRKLLELKGWGQKDLAEAMGKSESEISKWLSGLHNFTWKSIVKIETFLDAELIQIPDHANDNQPLQYTYPNGIDLELFNEPLTTPIRAITVESKMNKELVD